MQRINILRSLLMILHSLKIRKIFLVLTGLFASAVFYGQDTETFKPGGRPEARIFTSFNSAFADGENHSSFDLTRAYLGYSHEFSKSFSGRIVYDVADPSVGKLKFTGMLKFSYLRYQTDKWTITGGMIPLPEYEHADKKWGYRYLYKPFHDEYGFGTSADLGLSVAHKLASWISADVTLMNGEGFKLTETDSVFKAAAGITLLPVKNFSLRCYFDYMGKSGKNQQTVEVIASYNYSQFSLSSAYNFRKNQSMQEGKDYQGLSLNGTLSLSEKIRIFGRYDYLTSLTLADEDEPWNISKDGQLFLTGIELSLAPGINISPNFHGWKPAESGKPFVSRFSLSLDLKI